MEQTQQLTLERQWLEKLQEDFCSAHVTDDEMCNSLRKVHDKLNYVADPHTAVAMACAEKLGYDFTEEMSEGKMIPMVFVSTASPCKFQHAVVAKMGGSNGKTPPSLLGHVKLLKRRRTNLTTMRRQKKLLHCMRFKHNGKRGCLILYEITFDV